MLISDFHIAIFAILFKICTGDGVDQLHHYEMLQFSDIGRRVKRTADPNPASHLYQIWFTSFHRKFHLVLQQSSILPHHFTVKTENSKGEITEFHVPQNDFLQGKLEGDDLSHVDAHWEDDLLSASITTAKEVFIIEPAWRQLNASQNHSMIVYRQSDVKWNSGHQVAGQRYRFCGQQNTHLSEKNILSQIESNPDYKHVRLKRQVDTDGLSGKVCRLFIVADYSFHKNIGGGNKRTTARYMIGLLSRVNSIYKRTRWPDDNSDLQNLSFEIAEMKIHDDFTYKGLHYNNPNQVWNTTHLLQVFSRGSAFKDYCLAHLFTYHRFERAVLGLAYIAGPEPKHLGGICSTGPTPDKVYTANGYDTTFNTGWSSAQNSAGERVLSVEATLVIAHELGCCYWSTGEAYSSMAPDPDLWIVRGHNWGSEHDPDTEACAPTDSKGGKYLMYPYAVSGYEDNNQIFSTCSKRYIFNVLKAKGLGCFTDPQQMTVCGNGRIEGDEECDAGFNGDNCCSANCKLINSAKCSPMNYECCAKNCEIANDQTVCHALPDDSVNCKSISRCNGTSLFCPEANNKGDNTSCLDGGMCKNGICLNYCQIRDKYPCICPRESGFACYRCCKSSHNDTNCVPELENEILPNGRPCFKGVCVNGQCEKQINDVVQRLFSVIDSITVDQVVEFMKSNIVLTILFLSLMLWIPASCTFSHFDKKKERQIRDNLKWKSRSNYTLLLDDDRNRVKHVGNIKLKHFGGGGSIIRHNHFVQSQFYHDNDIMIESKV